MKKTALMGLVLSLSVSSLWSGTLGDEKTSYDWSGFYIGGSVGNIWSNFEGTLAAKSFIVDLLSFPASIQTFNASNNAIISGGQVGYNWQMNKFIIGTELSLNGMNLSKSHTLTVKEAQSTLLFSPGDSFQSSIKWQAQWVTRLGIGIENWLFYAVGGVAFSEAKIRDTVISANYFGFQAPTMSGSSSNLLFGGTVGAGTEYALTKHLHVGLEYRYSDYGSRNYFPSDVPAAYDTFGLLIYTQVISKMQLSTNKALAKIIYQF